MCLTAIVFLMWIPVLVCFPGPMTSLAGRLSNFHSHCLFYMSRSVLMIPLVGSCRIISWKSIRDSTRSQSTQTALPRNGGFWTWQVFLICLLWFPSFYWAHDMKNMLLLSGLGPVCLPGYEPVLSWTSLGGRAMQGGGSGAFWWAWSKMLIFQIYYATNVYIKESAA